MSTLVAVLLGVAVFVYVELAIFTGQYMYIKTSKQETSEKEKRQLVKYSVAAGIAFPITFAILAAYKATGKDGK